MKYTQIEKDGSKLVVVDDEFYLKFDSEATIIKYAIYNYYYENDHKEVSFLPSYIKYALTLWKRKQCLNVGMYVATLRY